MGGISGFGRDIAIYICKHDGRYRLNAPCGTGISGMVGRQERYQGNSAVFSVERRFGFDLGCLLPPYGLFASGIRVFGDWTVEAWLMVVPFPVGTDARPGFIGRCTGRRGSGML